jgi:hypothetical protein
MKTSLVSRFLLCGLSLFPASSGFGQNAAPASLRFLLPQVSGWTFSETPQSFLPATLFEYIDGAAEAYLSYDFKELVVAQYKEERSPATLTLEVYDMGNDVNSFGIYSAERYPESRYIQLGTQGYIEEGTLNFITGPYYVKLLCYDCGENAATVLELVAQDLEKKVKVRGSLPPLLGLFPREGLVAHSERFILRNVLGYGFLHDGYIAGYKEDGLEFDLFIIEGASEADAAAMLERYLASQARNNPPAEEIPLGYHLKDRYAQNIYVARVGKLILGVMRIKDGFEKTGLRYLEDLVRSAKSRP